MSSVNEIHLVIGSKTFVCNKSELIERSEYFNAMFCHEFIEKDKDSIVLNNVDEDAFEFILKDNQINSSLDANQVLSILKTSSMLQFNQQVGMYEEFILNNYFLDRPLMVMKECHLFNKLYEKSFACCLWNFDKLKDSQDFICLPVDCLIYYLDHEGLRTVNEVEVFDSICRWYDKNKIGLNDEIDLLKTIRFCRLTDEEVKRVIKSSIFLSITKQSNIDFKSGSYDFRNISKVLKCSEDELLDKVRKNPALPCCIYYDDQNIILNYYKADDNKLKEIKLTHELITSDFTGCSFVTVGFKLYLFGGEKRLGNGHYNMDVWSYDFLLHKWQIECRMNEQRRHFSTTVLNNDIFLVCGTGKYRKLLSSIVKFNVKTKKWSHCADLPNLNSLPPSVCSYKNKIYIFDCNYKLYSYDPINEILTHIPLEIKFLKKPNYKPLYHACHNEFVCIYKNELYLIRKDNSSLYKLNISDFFNHYEPSHKKFRSSPNDNSSNSHNKIVKSNYEYLGKFSSEGAYMLIGSCIFRFGLPDIEFQMSMDKYNLETMIKSTNLANCDFPNYHLVKNQLWVGILPNYFPLE